MQKTKFGISVGLFGAGLYFLGLFNGYLIVTLLALYILLFEENGWLRRTAVKVVVVMAVFSFWITIVNLIPDAIDVIDNIALIFGGHVHISFISSLVNAVVTVLNLVEKILLLGLGIKAFNQGTIIIPVVDKLINKYMG